MRFLYFLAWVLIAGVTNAQTKGFDVNKVYVTWEVVENHHQGKSQSLTAFTITNNNKIALPKSGWNLFFNFNRAIDPQSTASAGVKIEHRNGDLFQMTPLAGFNGIEPKASLRIEFVSGDWVINFTDAPAGLYFVFDANPSVGIPVTQYLVKPSTEPRQYLRSPNDKIGLLTPEKVYNQNIGIEDIALDKLPKIFPTPVSYQELNGEFILDGNVPIVTEAIFQDEAAYLAEELNKILGKKLSINSSSASRSIVFKKNELPEEAYHLDVTPDGITIAASSSAGIFYGIQSLKLLLPVNAWSRVTPSVAIPSVKVEDAPRFAFREFMLDVARNFQTKQEVMKVLDVMALYKLNTFHFHFTEDEGWRLEIPGLPELTEIGSKRGHTLDNKTHLQASFGSGPVVNSKPGSGYYTRADFIEILKYAHRRHILVIPEIETPGHARAAVKSMTARYERLMKEGKQTEAEEFLLYSPGDESVYSSAQHWNDNVMDVALPSTYRFLEKVTDEVIAMYKEAGAPLKTIHYGGDEVPEGVWQKSPAFLKLKESNPSIQSADDLWYYYYGKVNEIAKSRGLYLYGWEEIGMRKTMLDGRKHFIPNPDFADDNFQVDVWNNKIGWGAEDLAYRLANAGYKVVLSCVSNQYFDLAYYKDFHEPGYYWGGFVDMEKPFYFIPFDFFKNVKEDGNGDPVNPSIFVGKERLTDYGRSNIVGIQALLWAENLVNEERLEYLLLPKLLGYVERAWAQDPSWTTEKDAVNAEALYQQAWSQFVNTTGKRELPRLDYYAGGFSYRIPTAGAIIENEMVKANVQLPGFVIRYTTDGSEPNSKSKIYTQPIPYKGMIKLRVFDSRGRGGRTVSVGGSLQLTVDKKQ